MGVFKAYIAVFKLEKGLIVTCPLPQLIPLSSFYAISLPGPEA
jgi:hypothetical protein